MRTSREKKARRAKRLAQRRASMKRFREMTQAVVARYTELGGTLPATYEEMVAVVVKAQLAKQLEEQAALRGTWTKDGFTAEVQVPKRVDGSVLL